MVGADVQDERLERCVFLFSGYFETGGEETLFGVGRAWVEVNDASFVVEEGTWRWVHF
jgi:hypothetical protein